MPHVAFQPLEYLPILLFLAVAGGFAAAFVGLPVLVSRISGTNKPYADKLAEYESGFPAFSAARSQFDVRFYLVAILFIVFDIETAFLFPWAVSLGHIGAFGWFSMMEFLLELVVGLIYAWRMGALDFE